MKKPIFHVGDTVRVVTPQFVVRVGYPKTPADYLPLVETATDELLAVYRKLDLSGQGILQNVVPSNHDRIQHLLAYELAHKDRFGGNERVIHLMEAPEAKDKILTITALKTVVTGQYYPASGGYTTYGEYDYEPAELGNRKYHRLAAVDWFVHELKYEAAWIEVANLEKVDTATQEVEANAR